MVETWEEGLPFAWCMDLKQPTCLFGHHRTLCDQWWRTWFVYCIISQLDQAFTPPYRGTPDQFSRTYWRAFGEKHGWGSLGDNGSIWSYWKGQFPSLSVPMHLLMCPQIIAIVMDNASNNNMLMMFLEWQCQQQDIPFSVQDACLWCMPHTIHLVAIKVLLLSQLLCMHYV